MPHESASRNSTLTKERIEDLRGVILADRANWPSKAYPAEVNTLCDLAADAVSERGTLAVVKRVLQDCGSFGLVILDGPCVFCGYNGAGYWQKGTHAKDCPFHDVGGEIERADHIQPRQCERNGT